MSNWPSTRAPRVLAALQRIGWSIKRQSGSHKSFPPSLITEGTKCIFLSTSVRLYQALEAAGQETKLDVYEGMWHVFQLVPIPESEVAIRKSAAFINKHLK